MGNFFAQPLCHNSNSTFPTPPSDRVHRITSRSSTVNQASHVPSSPASLVPTSLLVHHVSQLFTRFPFSTPASSAPRRVHVPKPSVFFVPQNSREILDFSRNSHTPESKAMLALLADDPNQTAIALVGMGGAGKTTILRALGRRAEIWAKFPDGVWFIELGHDATVQKLLDQLEVIVDNVFPDFLPKFTQLAAKENTHFNMMNDFIDLLAPMRFLLILDDVSDLDPSLYTLVDHVCRAAQEKEGTCYKILTSTRNEQIGRAPTHDVSIVVSPEDMGRETCMEILCSYTGIDGCTLSTFSHRNRLALDSIIEMCAGLPLALSVAGSAMQDVLGAHGDKCRSTAVVKYWESLEKRKIQLSVAEGASRHMGLHAAVQLSLASLEKGWEGKNMRVREMFQSFCIVQKQVCLPLQAIEKLWNVPDALVEVRMLSRHSLLSLVEDDAGLVLGVRLHDLVHDLCVEMAGGNERVGLWHARFVDAYRASIRTTQSAENRESDRVEDSIYTEEEEWWNLHDNDKYMIDNLVRHMLEARYLATALVLLTDYRWIEQMNTNKERPPFQKLIAELQLLRKNLEAHKRTRSHRNLIDDIGVILRAMELSMPFSMNNRAECTFQLYGRLRDLGSKSGITGRILYSIEKYGRRPWARAGPGVLTSGRSSLRRVIEIGGFGRRICVGQGGDEVLVGGNGKAWVLDSRDGSVKRSFVDLEKEFVTGISADRSSFGISSCSAKGKVIMRKDFKMWRSLQVAGVQEEEKIQCMQTLPRKERIVLGTNRGRLLVIDMKNGKTIQTANAHSEHVVSLTAGEGEDVVVSGSVDGKIRIWDTSKFESIGNVMEGHTKRVRSMVLSGDGKLLASGSNDGTARLWNVQNGEQLWTSSGEHGNVVTTVLFSCDEQLLYSADLGAICVRRVSNGGRDVSLLHTFRHPSMIFIISLSTGKDSELFALNQNRVHVWDAQEVDGSNERVYTFIPDVYKFAISADGATMLTAHRSFKRRQTENKKWLEIHNVSDVSQRINRVISSLILPSKDWYDAFAVANNQRFVACVSHDFVVKLVDVRNGTVLHSLSDLHHWALGNDASNCSRVSDSNGTTQLDAKRGILSLWFSSDGSIISAVAVTMPGKENSYFAAVKSLSWSVSSGEPLRDVNHDDDRTASSSTAIPRLQCKKNVSELGIQFAKNVTCKQGRSSFTIATFESNITGAHYVADTSRLFFSTKQRGVNYVDLITDNTRLPPRHEPALPFVSQLNPPLSKDTETETEPKPDEVYDVFISHAGTDKLTIALPLYDLLVALGFKVFLDRTELRPGQNAPEKMIKAMRTAKIAVVILSPEFAARKWTLKELMCFLERFRAGGERAMIIIPVFYRLTLKDCWDQSTLFRLVNEDGQNVFVTEGFLERMAEEQEYGVGDVLRALQSLRSVTGIENKDGVTNGTSAAEKVAQMKFVIKISDAIVEAMERLKAGVAAGPSSAHG